MNVSICDLQDCLTNQIFVGEDPPSTETFEVKVTNGSDDQEAKVEERHEERPSNDVEDHSSSSDESHSKSTSSESEESAQEDKSNSSNQP